MFIACGNVKRDISKSAVTLLQQLNLSLLEICTFRQSATLSQHTTGATVTMPMTHSFTCPFDWLMTASWQWSQSAPMMSLTVPWQDCSSTQPGMMLFSSLQHQNASLPGKPHSRIATTTDISISAYHRNCVTVVGLFVTLHVNRCCIVIVIQHRFMTSGVPAARSEISWPSF